MPARVWGIPLFPHWDRCVAENIGNIEAAYFLHDKANKITEIRIKSVVAIGKELKEAQEKLANHKNGTFQAWVDSLGVGLSKSNAYNYIQAYDYIVQNLDNIEPANKIQPSLLFAISKPSSPQEL